MLQGEAVHVSSLLKTLLPFLQGTLLYTDICMRNTFRFRLLARFAANKFKKKESLHSSSNEQVQI